MAAASGSGDGQIVHGAIDGELADGAAGKTQGLNDKTIGGEGDGRASDFDACGVTERFC